MRFRRISVLLKYGAQVVYFQASLRLTVLLQVNTSTHFFNGAPLDECYHHLCPLPKVRCFSYWSVTTGA